MIPKSVVEATIARYQARTGERDSTLERLRTGSPVTVDTPARVQNRMMRLALTEAAAAPSPRAILEGPGVPTLGLERILGRSDLMSVTFLELAVAAARTVARVRIRSGSKTIGFGTGSLIGPRVMITNNHVLGAASDAATSLLEFNYQDGIDAPTVFTLEPDALFITDRALDFTIVAVKEASGETPVSAFGFNRLIEQEGKILLGESLNIIQHPNGELKQLALRENQLQDVLPQFLHYHTDTAPGSSGSPVYNDQWEMVALHHSGVPRTNAAGQFLTKDGTLWDESMGEQAIDWIANEGVRVSQIVAFLKKQGLSGTASSLRDSLFSAPAPAAARVSTPVPVPQVSHAAEAQGQVDAEGFATWRLPIEIRVRVGGDRAADVAVAPAASTSQPAAQPSATDAKPGATGAPAASGSDLQDALHAAEAGQTQVYFDEARNTAAREAYYAGIDANAGRAALFDALTALLERTHNPKPPYKPATHVYPFVDLHPDRKLRSIYSQKAFSPEELIREDFQIEQERTRRLQELVLAEGALTPEALERLSTQLEAELPFNCEHVVPQSWFGKREPMRGDVHHLFACENGCNSFRSNIPYFDFPDFEEATRTECGKRDGTRFEPIAAKGIVARATLYFLLRYPRVVNGIVESYDAGRLATLLSWHESHPVNDYERHRNMAIFEKQGNRNPLIDHPEWAAKIDFGKGL